MRVGRGAPSGAGTHGLAKEATPARTLAIAGLGSAREVDEYHVSPNLIRQLPQGYAVVQINAPATLDLVKLDHLETSRAAPYSPPLQDRALSTGLDLRRRAARRAASSPPAVAPATLIFEGA